MPNRRDLFKLTAFTAMTAFGDGHLPNSVRRMEDAKLTREEFGDLRIYYEGPTEQMSSVTAGSLLLKPGMSPHPPHQHPDEEFLVIAEGTGEVSVEGKVTNVGPGSMMYCGGEKLHGIVNTGKSPLLFYFYKWKK
jgi:mannose-6-phosphate isomerase-like protein (cupin superfamily)